jgi:hypothetical protein
MISNLNTCGHDQPNEVARRLIIFPGRAHLTPTCMRGPELRGLVNPIAA